MDDKENTPRAPSRLPLRSVRCYQLDRDCVICEKEIASRLGLATNTGGVVKVQSLATKNSLVVYANRRTDDWGLQVKGRLAAITDWKDVQKIRYHSNCYKSFRNIKRKMPQNLSPGSNFYSPSPPQQPSQRPRLSPSASGIPVPVRAPRPRPELSLPSSSRPHPTTMQSFTRPGRGRPVDISKDAAFQQLCDYLESSEESQHDLDALQRQLKEFNPQENYSDRSLRNKLQVRYQDQVTFSSAHKHKTVLTFNWRASQILSETYLSRNTADAKEQIASVARIICKAIDAKNYSSDVYPSISDIEEGGESNIPDELLLLIREIVRGRKKGDSEGWERKCVAIANSVLAAARPRTFLSPIHLALAIHVHRHHGSKLLVNILQALGFSSSYADAAKFESAIVFTSPARIDPGAYVQWVFDNFDYNVRSLEGLGTWHCMGGIQCVTPASSVGPDPVLQKSSANCSASMRAVLGTLPIKTCRYTRSLGLKSILVPDYSNVDFDSIPPFLHSIRCADYLWLLGTVLRQEPTPGWSGYMELQTKDLPCETTAVLPLPFVKLDPNNPNAIFTCLDYAVTESSRHGQNHCFVTFDQPLFWKAVDIVYQTESDSSIRKVLVRLGGFHLLMSYLGCIGYIMSGSGLEAIWELAYAKNSVVNMVGGHAYTRAIRAHYLTQVAVVHLVLEHFSEYFLQRNVNRVEIAEAFQRQLESLPPSSEPISPHVSHFLTVLDNLPTAVNVGRTGNLWLQYIKLVEYVRWFIRGERMGDWQLHMHAVKVMLPAFPAAGHLNYTKAIPLYLHIMSSLKETLSQAEYESFVTKGNFTVRLASKKWGGRSTDVTIEEELMAALKDQGGLTRGRGVTDATIATFVRTMPLCTRISRALRAFTGQQRDEAEQHVDLRPGRQRRDYSDIGIFYEYLVAHNPFNKPAHQLVSISTGVVGNDTVNCDRALEIGVNVLKKIAGRNFGELTLHRKDRVLPLSVMTCSITVGETVIPINVNQLFHRIVLLKMADEELKDCFQYELAPYPTSLFDEMTLRKGNKAALLKELDRYSAPQEVVPENPVFVIDGGYLLHTVVWPRPATYLEVADAYVSYVRALERRYTGKVTVVFDGYPTGPSLKDVEHMRRSLRTSADVTVAENAVVSTTQALFMTNSRNKEQLIRLLSKRFRDSDIDVRQASGDADVLIVLTAIELAEAGHKAVIVGEDTDLTVLMTALSPEGKSVCIMSSSTSKGVKVRHSSALQAALNGLKDVLLIAHAFSGCDTTSFPYRRSKITALKKLAKSDSLRSAVSVLNSPTASVEEVVKAGELFFLAMYGCETESSLDQARYAMYKRIITRQPIHAKFEPATLPPTSDAAQFHSVRVYVQVQTWKGTRLNPTLWQGWREEDGKLIPVRTSIPPAPQKVLKLVFCNCRTPCSNNNCECVRGGLPCSDICGQCAGVSCLNVKRVEDSPEVEEEEQLDDPREAFQVLGL